MFGDSVLSKNSVKKKILVYNLPLNSVFSPQRLVIDCKTESTSTTVSKALTKRVLEPALFFQMKAGGVCLISPNMFLCDKCTLKRYSPTTTYGACTLFRS